MVSVFFFFVCFYFHNEFYGCCGFCLSRLTNWKRRSVTLLGSQRCQVPTSCQTVNRKYKYRGSGFIITYLSCRRRKAWKAEPLWFPVQPRTAWLRNLLNCQFIVWVVTTLAARMDLMPIPLDKQGLGKRPWSGLSSNQQGCACLPRLGLHRMAQGI